MGAARSRNFIVQCSDPALDRQIAEAAEKYRHDLAVSWLGKAMPDWAGPCVMTVRVGPGLGAGGATTFMFDRGEVFGWRMSIQGPRERVFDSVLPHEITHMVLASHFRRPLPRWADEGAATSAECAGERDKHYRMLREFLCTRRGIPFSTMFAMTEYPADVMPLYAQGFSTAEYLIQQGGRRKFIAFLEDGLAGGQWVAAVKRHYGPANLGELQNEWLAWVRDGRPSLPAKQTVPGAPPEIMLAGAIATGSKAPRGAAAPARSIRVPGEQLAVAGRRPWPEPNLIYHVPRNPIPACNATASCDAAPATAGAADGTDCDRLVPIVRPARCCAAVTGSCPQVSSPTCSQMSRPQSPEPAQQIILEWSKPGVPVPVSMCGQQGTLR